jgi:hypothetical protein
MKCFLPSHIYNILNSSIDNVAFYSYPHEFISNFHAINLFSANILNMRLWGFFFFFYKLGLICITECTSLKISQTCIYGYDTITFDRAYTLR